MIHPLEDNQLRKIYEWYCNPEYDIFFRHFDPLLGFDEFLSSFKLCMSKGLSVFDNGKMIGFAMIRSIPKPKICEVSFLLDKNFQEQGFAVKTTIEIAELLFGDYGFNLMVMIVSADDKRTNEIVQKGKLKLEARQENSCFYGRRYHSENRYVMDRETFLKEYGGL